MFKFSTTYINLISMFVSIIIFIFVQLFISNYKFFTHKGLLKAGFYVENQIQNNIENNEKISNNINNIANNIKNNENDNASNNEQDWYIEIPSISLKANIKEGTTKEILEDYVGHFEDTPKINGNVGLAGHNRGYKNNYFAHIKELKNGETIIYNYYGESKKYCVTSQIIIKDTQWDLLENTDENMITLITCVENQPEYRRCIQGKEI